VGKEWRWAAALEDREVAAAGIFQIPGDGS